MKYKNSIWKVAGITVLLTMQGVAYLLNGMTVNDVLVAYDKNKLEGILKKCTTKERHGVKWLFSQKSSWERPLDEAMWMFGKGVDTFVSTKDRDEEFAIGELAKKDGKTPYEKIFEGALKKNPQIGPELFFKMLAEYCTGPGGHIGVRHGCLISKPEMEFGAVFAPGTLRLVGWIICNDQTVNVGGTLHLPNGKVLRINGETDNPLYLPQAKTFEDCIGAGPCIVLSKEYPAKDTKLTIVIKRDSKIICRQTMRYSDYIRDTRKVVKDTLIPAWGFMVKKSGFVLALGTATHIPNEASVKPGDVITMSCPSMFRAPFVQTVRKVA
jgi:fumarylacetoacetate (FAA) hydrolase family protein